MLCHLCDDLIVEISGMLPIKSLIHYRSISKSWFARISSRNFIRMHALRSTKTPQKVIVRQQNHYGKDGHIILYTLDPEDHYASLKSVNFSSIDFHIVGSCNGIICVIQKEVKLPLIGTLGESSLCLWNPSIRRKLNVPSHPFGCVALGFGFDAITDDYKIVSIPLCKYSGVAKFSFMYSMKTNSWNAIQLPTTFYYDNVKSPFPCFVNRTLHWVVRYQSENIDIHHCILTFNLSTRVFDMIQLPQPSWVMVQLTIIKGCLAVISNDGHDNWIWVRKEHKNAASWSKPYNFTNPISEGADSIFGLTNHGDFESYNPETGVRSRLMSSLDSSFTIELDMCVGSLELLDNEAWPVDI